MPTDRVIRVAGLRPEAISLLAEPLPADAPAIVIHRAQALPAKADVAAAVLAELEAVAMALFPAWLPGAEGITGTGGATVPAVRALAIRLGSSTHHFGPFLADLAEGALRGAPIEPARFATEVRVAGLARLIADSFGRSRTAVLVDVPDGLTPSAEQAVVSGCEWLADRGRLGLWLTGAPLAAVDWVEDWPTPVPTPVSPPVQVTPSESEPSDSRFPAIAGKPRPGAEGLLESALQRRAWAAGRAWNQPYRLHALANPIVVDLLWRQERCVVEVDGPEHRAESKFEADHRRDVQLHLAGYAVLRFTNAQILTDVEAVVHQIERFIQGRRLGTFEGRAHGERTVAP
jgi:very-short-patch-repair endonuclease